MTSRPSPFQIYLRSQSVFYTSVTFVPCLQITSNEDENGALQLSIRRIEFARAWERVRQIQVRH
jgi:hypothetical protein